MIHRSSLCVTNEFNQEFIVYEQKLVTCTFQLLSFKTLVHTLVCISAEYLLQ